jgi:hypothetical protein
MASFERAGDDLLGAAPTVEGCGVDPVDPQVERMSNRTNRRRIVLRSPPDGPVTASFRSVVPSCRLSTRKRLRV